MRLPSTNPITLPFGATTAPYSPSSPHNGTDFSYILDNKIYAPFDGITKQVPNNGRDGNGTYMYDPEGRFHGFLHASQYLVPNNSKVAEGQPIAVMGDTGFAQGVHLHWCIKVNNQFIDPMSIIKEEEIMSVVNDGDTSNYFQALFDRQPDQAELDKNRGKEWNSPDPKLRAPLYDDMLGRGHYLTEENKRLQKLVDQGSSNTPEVTVNGVPYEPTK